MLLDNLLKCKKHGILAWDNTEIVFIITKDINCTQSICRLGLRIHLQVVNIKQVNFVFVNLKVKSCLMQLDKDQPELSLHESACIIKPLF